MSERIGSKNPLRHLKIGREAMRVAHNLDSQRTTTFEEFFGGASPSGKEQYLRGRAPIIQPENPSPLAAMLLDGLGDGTVALKNAIKESSDLSDESLKGLAILALTKVDHQRPFGDHTVPGELDGWFIGTMHVASLTYGTEVPMLLQPSQVKLRTPTPVEV